MTAKGGIGTTRRNGVAQSTRREGTAPAEPARQEPRPPEPVGSTVADPSARNATRKPGAAPDWGRLLGFAQHQTPAATAPVDFQERLYRCPQREPSRNTTCGGCTTPMHLP